MYPLVTIITPYLNASRFLDRFVYSVRAQTYTQWLCIMVDDGSTDNGPSYLRELTLGDPRFLLISNTFSKEYPGPASARNCALSCVSSPLIAFCDVDDIWHPEKLERQICFHQANNLDLSVSAYGRFLNNRPGQPVRAFICPPSHLSFSKLRGPNPIPMLTVLMSSDLASNGFLQLPHEDFLYWIDLFRHNPSLRYGCLKEVLSFYCIHRDNLSGCKSTMPFWTYRVFRQSGDTRLTSVCSLLFWLLGHLMNQIKVLLHLLFRNNSYVPYLLLRSPLDLSRQASSHPFC